MTSNGIPSPRDDDVVHILVRHQEVRKKETTKRNAEELKFLLTVADIFNHFFVF